MPEPILQPDISAPHTTSIPAPSIVPAGVDVQGATPPTSYTPSQVEMPEGKDHFAFLKEIDWVEAIVVVGFLAVGIYLINYYATQLKTQKGAIATISSEISDLQTSITELKQQQIQNTKSTNSSGRFNTNGKIQEYF